MGKGSISDVLVAAILLFIFALTTVIGFVVYREAAAAMASGISLNTEAQSVLDSGGFALKILDYGFLFVFIGLIAAVVISGMYIDSNPVFFIFAVLVLAIYVIISVPFANAYSVFANSTANVQYAITQYPIITFIVSNMPLIVVMIGALFFLAIYGKSRGGNYDVF